MRAAGLIAVVAVMTGCQAGRPVSSRRLIEHAAVIDFSGLRSAQAVDSVNLMCAVPRQWTAIPPKHNALYSHQQWKSPSGHTGFGVAYIHLPLPFGTKMLVWLAKQEYSKKADDGKVLKEWEDDLGRSWFEAENSKYHVRGYAMTQGFEAWIIYFGYRTHYPPDPGEISLAARSVDSIVPGIADAPTTQPVVMAR